jgi:hypothetical protein
VFFAEITIILSSTIVPAFVDASPSALSMPVWLNQIHDSIIPATRILFLPLTFICHFDYDSCRFERNPVKKINNPVILQNYHVPTRATVSPILVLVQEPIKKPR